MNNKDTKSNHWGCVGIVILLSLFFAVPIVIGFKIGWRYAVGLWGIYVLQFGALSMIFSKMISTKGNGE